MKVGKEDGGSVVVAGSPFTLEADAIGKHKGPIGDFGEVHRESNLIDDLGLGSGDVEGLQNPGGRGVIRFVKPLSELFGYEGLGFVVNHRIMNGYAFLIHCVNLRLGHEDGRPVEEHCALVIEGVQQDGFRVFEDF